MAWLGRCGVLWRDSCSRGGLLRVGLGFRAGWRCLLVVVVADVACVPGPAAGLALAQQLIPVIRACRVAGRLGGDGVVPVAVELVAPQVPGFEGTHVLVRGPDSLG